MSQETLIQKWIKLYQCGVWFGKRSVSDQAGLKEGGKIMFLVG